MKDFLCKDGKFSWDELRSLAKALGYNETVFYDAFHEEQQQQSNVTREGLNLLLEGSTFYPYLNKTFNQHDGSYNIKVVSKAIELLMQRYFSFSLLRLARVSFQTYEHSDAAGLQEVYILRALKLCNKTMAPLKLQQMLRHMKRLVSDRLMLYEYFEIVASADNLNTVSAGMPVKKQVNKELGARDIFELCDFEEELLTDDERYYKYLDEQFRDSLKIIPMKSAANRPSCKSGRGNKEWVKPPLALTQTRIANCSSNRTQSKKLWEYLRNSNDMVSKTKYDEGCSCGLQNDSNISDHCSNDDKNSFQENQQNEIPKMHENVNQSKERCFPLIVTDEEIEMTKQQIENIQWDLVVKKGNLRKKYEDIKTKAKESKHLL